MQGLGVPIIVRIKFNKRISRQWGDGGDIISVYSVTLLWVGWVDVVVVM